MNHFIFPQLLGVIDSFGVYGSALHYGLVIAFVGSAFLIFLYLWGKGRLGLDEEASIQMMKDDTEIFHDRQ